MYYTESQKSLTRHTCLTPEWDVRYERALRTRQACITLSWHVLLTSRNLQIRGSMNQRYICFEASRERAVFKKVHIINLQHPLSHRLGQMLFSLGNTVPGYSLSRNTTELESFMQWRIDTCSVNAAREEEGTLKNTTLIHTESTLNL